MSLFSSDKHDWSISFNSDMYKIPPPYVSSFENNTASLAKESQRIANVGIALDNYDKKRKIQERETINGINRIYDTVIRQATEFNEVLKEIRPPHSAQVYHKTSTDMNLTVPHISESDRNLYANNQSNIDNNSALKRNTFVSDIDTSRKMYDDYMEYKKNQCKATCEENFDKTMKTDTFFNGCVSAMSGGDAFMAPIFTEVKAAHTRYNCHKTCDKK